MGSMQGPVREPHPQAYVSNPGSQGPVGRDSCTRIDLEAGSKHHTGASAETCTGQPGTLHGFRFSPGWGRYRASEFCRCRRQETAIKWMGSRIRLISFQDQRGARHIRMDCTGTTLRLQSGGEASAERADGLRWMNKLDPQYHSNFLSRVISSDLGTIGPRHYHLSTISF